jgi:7-keto-8-aminopelargonate synthetase-like enzyme
MDDSYGIGTLGATGRGTCEHYGIDVRDTTESNMK